MAWTTQKDGGSANTTTAESFFAFPTWGYYSASHGFGRKHTDWYWDESEFRWDRRKAGDGGRVVASIKSAGDSRLMYGWLRGKFGQPRQEE
jgi:hypothetical protein